MNRGIFTFVLIGICFVCWDVQADAINCLKLENIEIGCVPSIDHTCRRNNSVDKPNVPCQYVARPGAFLRVEGPIAWKCKSEKVDRTCNQVCNSDGCQEVCTTTSECLEYYPPICDEECVDCFEEVTTQNVGVSRGCIICTRLPCEDERPRLAATSCPAKFNGMIHHDGQKCSSDRRCDDTAVDPNGVTHQVTGRRPTCQPKPMPPEPREGDPLNCPWKIDERTGGWPPRYKGPNDPGDPGACECIRRENSTDPNAPWVCPD